MKFAVRQLQEAEEDLLAIYLYVAAADSVDRAELLLERLEATIGSLDQLARRGRAPPELAKVGVREFREIVSRPYRIVYEITGRTVFVHAVLDGRRDLVDLLAERLLR